MMFHEYLQNKSLHIKQKLICSAREYEQHVVVFVKKINKWLLLARL